MSRTTSTAIGEGGEHGAGAGAGSLSNRGPDDASADERPTKRRRIATACQACRNRKSKCCGSTPLCSACRQMNTECVYPTSLSKIDILRQEFTSMVGSLETRMGGIERLLSSLESRLGNPIVDAPVTPASRQVETDRSTAQSPDNDITISENAFQGPLQADGALDGIGIIPLSSREDCAFFGPSSNIVFLRLVSRAMAKVAGPSRLVPPIAETEMARKHRDVKAQSVLTGFPGLSTNSQSPATYSIPSDLKARELIRGYFVTCGYVHPYIHEGSFMDIYEETRRSNFTKVRRSWLALLYCIFAISCVTRPLRSSTVAFMSPQSEAWYKLASEMCLKQVFSEHGVTLETVQCLLLMVLYLQGTHSSMKTSFIHGLAVKTAYQLGLHSGDASRTADPIENEIRKRVWCGLVLLDRTLSMAIGRPPEFHTYSVHSKPELYHDAAERGNLDQDKASVSFLNVTLDLYEILQRTIDTLYGRNYGPRTTFSLEGLAKVYSLESDLLNWTRTLPPHLELIAADELLRTQPLMDVKTSLIRRQKTLVTLRYLMVRIQVHRPVLEGLLDATISPDSDTQYFQTMRQAGANSVALEVSCAVRLIGVVNSLVLGTIEGHSHLGVWWFSLFYVFNASLAILGGLLVSCPRGNHRELLTTAEREAASRALEQSLEVLDGLDEGHSTVARCRSYLQELIHVAERLPKSLASTNYSLDQGAFAQRSDFDGYPTAFDNAQADFAGSNISLPTPFQQFSSDINLENFLFPLDTQTFGGQLVGMDQPFI